MTPPKDSIVTPDKSFKVPAICPLTQESREFDVTFEYINEHRELGIGWKYFLAQFLHLVTSNPTVIFEGLEREGLADGYCYCGKIDSADMNNGSSFCLGEDRVLLVFVKWTESGFLIFDWDKREEESNQLGWPQGWSNDFKEPKWQKT